MTDEMKAKRELLFSGSKNGYDRVDQQTLDAMEAYCRDYKSFLDHSKTERECTAHTVALAEAAGFIPYERGMALQPGDRVYRVNRKKSVMLAVIGRESLSEGAQIVACHIDSPRLDLKPHPIYEDSELAYGKTHYYGGIRKYQWVAIPLQLRGVVALKDGTAVSVVLGEGDEPKFVINDLLPHLGGEQGKKPLNEAIAGETLNILMGSRPLGDSEDSDRVKLRVLDNYDREVFTMTKQLGHALATYKFYQDGELYGTLEKQFDLVRDRFTMEVTEGTLELREYSGTVGHNYKVTLNGEILGAIMDDMDLTVENAVFDNAYLIVYRPDKLPLLVCMAVMAARELARDKEGAVTNQM